MSKKTIRHLVSYIVALLIGVAMSLLVASNYGFGAAPDKLTKYRILCDACTIPGVFLLCCGLLSWIAEQGTFDILAYAGRSIFRVFHREANHIRYYEFVEERREKRAERERGHFLFLIFTGAAFLVAAVIFMLLFYRLYN